MGYEAYLEKSECYECRVKPGELHAPGCEIEQCPACGFSVTSCDHGDDVLEPDSHFWGRRIPWSGVMSMTEEAVEYGLFVRWEESGHGPLGSWVTCSKDHPDAKPDRNSIARRCRWDRDKRRFVLVQSRRA